MVDPQDLQIIATDEDEVIAKVKETCAVSIAREHAYNLLKSTYAASDLMYTSYSYEESELYRYFGENTSYDLVEFNGVHNFAWWLQGKQSRIGKRMGYLGVSSVDEQGTVWMVDMLGKEYLLGDYFETPSSVSHRERNPEYTKFVSDEPRSNPSRITYDNIKHKLQPPLDCSEVSDLRGQYFHNRLIINYENTNFAGCVLYHCFPNGIPNAIEVNPAQSEDDVTLKGANLKDADLWDAHLEGADLEGADLFMANFSGADLREANLRGANLVVANLSWANLLGANLRDAVLEGADLEGADLEVAELEGADLQGANLEGANLQGANLLKADFTGAKLKYANLYEANLYRANLGDAKYNSETNFEDSNITQRQLDSMTFVPDEE
jgi:uncharacterized protein YjbI with pentapeptide repeats